MYAHKPQYSMQFNMIKEAEYMHKYQESGAQIQESGERLRFSVKRGCRFRQDSENGQGSSGGIVREKSRMLS